MKSRDELYQDALRAVAENRQRAVARARRQSQEIHAALPGLEALERNMQAAGAAAMLAVLDKDDQQRQACLDEQARLERERAAMLAGIGRAPDALEPHYHCPICKDTGKAGGVLCDCVHLTARAMRRAEINAASPLELSDFSGFLPEVYPDAVDPELGANLRQYMQKMLDYCRRYADDFTPESKNLLLMGNAGLGKTRLALSIADRVLNKGYDVIYASAADLTARLEREHFDQDETPWMDTVKTADLLILDDLGTEFLNSYTLSALYELINTRALTRRATIYTTNITDASVFESRYTEKIASRILGNCKLLRFFGTDLRVSGH